jgi:hypothetical protein
VSSLRWVVTFVLGVIMFVLGVYVGARPRTHNSVVTGARWLDMAFAAVFMLRLAECSDRASATCSHR